MAVFLTKKYLSRRTFLRGTGVALGLPFLEALVFRPPRRWRRPRRLRRPARLLPPPARPIMNNTPFGKEVDCWTSTGKGADFKLGHTARAAGAVQEIRHDVREPREHRGGRFGAHTEPGDVAVVRASRHGGEERPACRSRSTR